MITTRSFDSSDQVFLKTTGDFKFLWDSVSGQKTIDAFLEWKRRFQIKFRHFMAIPPALAKVLLATSLVSQQTDEWRMVTTHTFNCTWRIIPYKAIYLSDEWFYNSTIKATQDISLTGFGFLRTRKFLPVRSLGPVWDIELSRQLS